jgi:hypothetical protein
MVLERRHILRRLTATKANELVFETQLVFLWREMCHHLETVDNKAKGRGKKK